MIRSKIKSIIAVLIVTVFVYVTYDNLQKIDAERSLHVGVTEVELTDWTKTREPNEIGDGEKKLNSHVDLAELNKNISASDVESIKDLYDINKKLREILRVTTVSNQLEELSNADNIYEKLDEGDDEFSYKEENINSTSSVESEVSTRATGNKVLRTIINFPNGGEITYNLNTLCEYLKSDKPINWQEDKTITWDLYTSIDPENKKTSIEWRMLSAKFDLSEEQYNLLINNEAYAVLGVPTDDEYGFELMIPYNDIISIYVNKNLKAINYQNRNTQRSYNLDGQLTQYKATSLSKCTNIDKHKTLSNHTDYHHIDCGVFNNEKIMDTDINKKLKLGENTIDILVGNFISNEITLNNSCGFSKLNLYIIEKPKLNVNIQFYKYKNGEIVYFDQDYMPTKGDKVYVRIDIENISDKFVLNNLNLDAKIGDKSLKINTNNIIYNGKTITKYVRCYINDDFSKDKINALEKLDIGSKVTIMSDEIVYSVTQNDANKCVVICTGDISTNYIREDFTHIGSIGNKNAIRIPVSGEYGTLNFTCSVEGEQTSQKTSDDVSFMLNISNNNEFANLIIKPGQTYTVNNLSINDIYYINLIVPQNYEVVDTQTYSSSSQNTVNIGAYYAQDYRGNIQIKLKQKSNPYFYKNKQSKVDISFK